ncbi:PHP domain protein, partial [mine drainage metagenome]
LLPGVEVSTRDGHLLAYGVAEAPPRHRDLETTADWVRDHGGEPVIAHPFRWRHGAGGRLTAVAHVAGIEVRNAHNSAAANRRAEEWAELRHLAARGGSDVHVLADVGRAVTVFPDPVAGVDDLLEAIRTGRTRAAGASMSFGGRLGLLVSNGAKFVARGLRPV